MAYTNINAGDTGGVARGIINGLGLVVNTHNALSGSDVHALGTVSIQSASAVNVKGVVSITSGSIVSGTLIQELTQHKNTSGSDVHALGTVSIQSASAVNISGGLINAAKYGTITDYSLFESDGTLTMSGSATVWEDLRVPMTATNNGGSKIPGYSLFRANGGSQGIFAYQFDKSTEEELYFEVQMPHSYKLGTNIIPHVHWGVITTPAGGTTVRWGLEYTWADISGVFAAPVIVYTTATDPVTQYKHVLNNFTTISGSSISDISSMILCRVFRDVANDNFDDDAALLEIDFHYESDTLGSRQVLVK